MTEKVIATKHKRFWWVDVILTLGCILCLAFFWGYAIICFINADYKIGALFSVSGIMFTVGAIWVIFDVCRYRTMPQILITYKDGKYHFYNGISCTAKEITGVTCKHARTVTASPLKWVV